MVHDWQHRQHQAPSKPQWRAGCSWCSFWIWLGPCKVTSDVLAHCPEGHLSHPAQRWQGSGASFGCLPATKLGEGKEQDLCCQEGGGVWQGGHCRGAELLRSELKPWWFHRTFPVTLPEPEVLDLLCCRAVEEWVLAEETSQFCLLFFPHLREPHFCVCLWWRILTLLLCEQGPKAVVFLRVLVELFCRN